MSNMLSAETITMNMSTSTDGPSQHVHKQEIGHKVHFNPPALTPDLTEHVSKSCAFEARSPQNKTTLGQHPFSIN